MYPLNRILRMADPTPGGAPTTDEPGSSDMASSMVAEMMAASATPEPSPEPSAPAPEPPKAPPTATPQTPPKGTPPAKPAPAAKAPPTPAKPDPKPAPAPPKAAAPAAEKPLDWQTAPEQFRAAHEKLVQVHKQETTRFQTELEKNTAKMRELEGKKFLTPDQEQRYAKLEQDQQQLQAELYARDYRESPEFKAKYEAKGKAIYGRIGNELKSIRVMDGENERPATMADFQKIQALGDSQVEQRRAARAMFGDDADVVIGAARELQSLHDQANEEIEAKRNGFQSERENKVKQTEQQRAESMQAFNEHDRLLTEKFPHYFAPIDGNDEFNKAMDEGLRYVDATSAELANKTPQEAAHATAMLRRFAGAFPGMQVLLKQKDAELTTLREQVTKLRGSDPGELGEGGGGGGDKAELGGTDAFTDEIAKLQRSQG